MDVRSIDQVPALPMHQGTVPVWWLVEPREMKEATRGGYLELAAEFEVAGGGHVHPHHHHTHEYYYVLNGRGVMTVDEEEREVVAGDFIYIPPIESTAFGRSATRPRFAASSSPSASQTRPRWTTR